MISMKKNMCAAAAALAVSLVPAVDAAADVTAAEVWKPAPEPEEPPFVCDQQPAAMIKAGGYDKVCIERGQAICRDNGKPFGEWKFGLDKDSGEVKLVDPDGEEYYNKFLGATKLCIANINFKNTHYDPYDPHYPGYRNLRSSNNEEENDQEQERELGKTTEPYLAIYSDTMLMAELVCKEVGNEGVATQLKMTDLRGYDLETDGFPFFATKLKRGQLEENDANALWGIEIDHEYVPISLQKVKPVLVANMKYDETRCKWMDYSTDEPTFAPTYAPTASAAPTVPLRTKGESCSLFKKCDPNQYLWCDRYADEYDDDEKYNSKDKYHYEYDEEDEYKKPVTDSSYYSPFNLLGECVQCKPSTTDLYQAIPCTPIDPDTYESEYGDECCPYVLDKEYKSTDKTGNKQLVATTAPGLCGPLYHGGPNVCRPSCAIQHEICTRSEDCCSGHCFVPDTGPGKQGIGFCVQSH
mmetsp:Transcript_21091/g.45978  ORF Transcript_21091/g.45978 Transcript_21091/m.45978 type:complete len:468 (+) Transcript_21091:118-1521(+)